MLTRKFILEIELENDVFWEGGDIQPAREIARILETVRKCLLSGDFKGASYLSDVNGHTVGTMEFIRE